MNRRKSTSVYIPGVGGEFPFWLLMESRLSSEDKGEYVLIVKNNFNFHSKMLQTQESSIPV